MNKKDLVIIGGGPAGYSAGLYASRAAVDTLLIESACTNCLLENTDFIENYPGFAKGISGFELMQQIKNQAERFGLQKISSDVQKITPLDGEFVIETEGEKLLAKAVIVATGAQPRMLGVSGEFDYLGRGVSYCATCDGAFYRGKTIAVVGGGDAAVEEAIFLTRFAKKVLIIHRRGELRATKVIQQRAFENKKIEFVWHSVVEEITGRDFVETLLLKDVRTQEKTNLKVGGIFIYVGLMPQSGLVKDIVKLDETGYIVTDENMQTTLKGVFAAGDVRQKLLRQIVTAAADGAIAAVAAEKHLESR
jgi:thioredoxin reductase (NADPH)